jgi:enterochelin esterase-like enzyme
LKHGCIVVLVLAFSLGVTACAQSDFITKTPELASTPAGTPAPHKIQSSFTPSPTLSPSPALTPTPNATQLRPTPLACHSETGEITQEQLTTSWLKDPLEYRVYTPPCYLHDLDQSYPVLYLIHGFGFNDDQWERLAVGEIADQLITSGQISPLIVVMPHDRNHNVLPPENQFGEALVFDLIPAIDTSYRTVPDRLHRTIGGISRGGNWAIHLGLNHWEVFGAIGGHSSPLFITDGLPKIDGWLQEIPQEYYPRIYLDIGESDRWTDHIIRLEELLDSFSVPHELHIFPGNHTEAYWSSHIEQYLRWYAKEW